MKPLSEESILISGLTDILERIREDGNQFTREHSLLKTIEYLSNQVEKLVSPKVADRKLTAHIRDNKIVLQEADYVEDGNLIKIDGDKIELYEIPYGGGNEIFIGKFNTIIEAIAKGDTLT